MDEKTKKIMESIPVIEAQMQAVQLNENMGVTGKYERSLYEDKKALRAYKSKWYGDSKQKRDAYTGKVVRKSHKTARKSYGSNYAQYASETDHVVALKEGHGILRHNPFLTDQDVKEILNSPSNYREVARQVNNQKREMDDLAYITGAKFNNKTRKFEKFDTGLTTKGKAQMAVENINAKAHIIAEASRRTAQNIGNEFVTGAKETLAGSVIPLTSMAVWKMCMVASGEESFEDAAKDMGKAAINIAVVGGEKRIAADVLSSVFKNSSSEFLKSAAGSNLVGQIVVVGALVQESATKYLNGEISGEEFVEEIGTKGMTMVVGMLGGQVGEELGKIIGGAIGTIALPGIGTVAGAVIGAVVGKVLGTILVTVSCAAVMGIRDVWKHMDDYKKKEHLLRRIETDALAEMECQRKHLREIFEKEFSRWDETIQQGFDIIMRNACEGVYNAAGVAEGLDKILKLFGKEVKFRCIEEYEEQINQTLELTF